MQITSRYLKKLHFQIGEESLGIEPNQVVTVENKLGIELIKNPWIVEIIEKKVELPKEKVESIHVPIENVEIKEKKEILKKEKITIEEIKRSNQDKTIKD